jgi:hypothetical protein
VSASCTSGRAASHATSAPSFSSSCSTVKPSPRPWPPTSNDGRMHAHVCRRQR